MPANLSPGYFVAESKYKKAQTIEEKIEALEEMLRTIPKHKGTEKMCADIKTRISKSKAQLEHAKASGKKGPSFHIPKEGAAQCAIVGPPNAGKSSILANFTKAPAVVGDYPYTTTKPQPGMLFYEDVSFQLVDLPPISADYMESWTSSLIRIADLILLTVGLDNINDLDVVISRLSEYKITLDATISEPRFAGSDVQLPVLLIVNKSDISSSVANLDLIREIYGHFKTVQISTHNPSDRNVLGRSIYDKLRLLRVYSKAPGKEPNTDQPVIVRKGALITDAASAIHKDFATQLKYARVWGSKVFEGQRVTKDYILEEGDVIEFRV